MISIGKPNGSPVGYAYCGDHKFLAKDADCTSMFNEKKFKEYFDKNCVGKKSCKYNMADPQFIDGTKLSSNMTSYC